MTNILDQIKEAEALGIVGDNKEVRTELVRKVNEGIITVEQSLEYLKKIKRKAHKEGLLIRSDFSKNKIWDFKIIQQRIIFRHHEKIEKKLLIKEDIKKKSNKI